MIPRSLLQQQAYDFIKKKILSFEFVPGNMYSETKLAAEAGISRTPMRDALQWLSQDGYITIVPSKGFQIRELTSKGMVEAIQVRCAIEGFSTSHIVEDIETPKAQELLATLEYLVSQMELYKEKASFDHEALALFIDFDHRFHLKLVEYVGNSEFEKLYQRLMYTIRLTSSEALANTWRIQETYDEHRKYLDALKKGKAHDAYTTLINHLMMPMKLANLVK